MNILVYALGSALGGLLALGIGWLLVEHLIWPWIQRREARPVATRRARSAMFAGDATNVVMIDCETTADVLIAGSAVNVTMENVRHTPRRSFGEWTEEARDRVAAADWIKATEHELAIKGHEDTCDICGPKRTCQQLDRVGASGMVAWCPIGQGEKVCAVCSWTGSQMIETQR